MSRLEDRLSKEELKRLYVEENKTAVDIGKMYGLGKSTVGRYLRKYGIPIRTNSEVKLKEKILPSEDELRKLYVNEKKSTVEIGMIYNLSNVVIGKYLKKYGISIRTNSEAHLKGNKLPSEDKLRILYIAQEKSAIEIGKLYGLSGATIGSCLREYDIPVRTIREARLKGKKLPSEEELRRLYVNEKLSATEIGKIYRFGKSTIGVYLKKYNIPIRSSGKGSSLLKDLLEDEK